MYYTDSLIMVKWLLGKDPNREKLVYIFVYLFFYEKLYFLFLILEFDLYILLLAKKEERNPSLGAKQFWF